MIGAGVAVPAFVDTSRRRIVTSSSLGMHDVDLIGMVEERVPERIPVVMDSRSNCRAMTQAPQPHRGVLAHLEVDATVGAGIVIDGRLSRGARGYAGSVGHIPLDPAGPPCDCGNRGCLEALVGLNRLARLANIAEPAPTRHHDVWRDTVISTIRERAERSDRATLAALDEVGHWLGVGCVAIIHTFNPDVVTIGGYPPHFRTSLDTTIQSTAERMSLVAHRSECTIGFADSDPTSIAVGAATLGLEMFLADPVDSLRDRTNRGSSSAPETITTTPFHR